MKPLILTLAVCLLSMGASPAHAQINPDSFTRSDIVQALGDDPSGREPQRVTEANYTPLLQSSAVMDAFRLILKSGHLRRDDKVRARLEVLSETHPFTHIRQAAHLLLSDYAVDTNILDTNPIFWAQRGYTTEMQKSGREPMQHCAPPPGASRPDFELEAEQKAKAANRSRASYRFETPLKYGTLRGGYYTIQGVGLSYTPHTAPEKPVRISSGNNRYVMPSDQAGAYWLIDGPNHMIGGGTITRLVESPEGIERFEHRTLPSGVAQIFELPDGDIFINFANLDPSKRGGTWTDGKFTPTPLDFYNPPIILHPNGKISHACTQDAPKF